MNTAVAVCHIILFHLSMGFRGFLEPREPRINRPMRGVVVISREKKWIGTYRRSRRITCDLELVYFVGLRIMLEAIK